MFSTYLETMVSQSTITRMCEISRILERSKNGDASAAEDLLPLVYEELRSLAKARMSHEREDHTLQSTALVHEAYLRIAQPASGKHWEGRSHFFAAAAEAMRRILIESARARKSLKRGGGAKQVQLCEHIPLPEESLDDLLDIDAGLERLQRVDTLAAEIVKLRLFAGMSVTEAGEALGMSRSAAYDNWKFARAWIQANWAELPFPTFQSILAETTHDVVR